MCAYILEIEKYELLHRHSGWCAGVMVGHFFIHTEQGPRSLFLRNRRSTRTPGGPAAAIGKAKLEGLDLHRNEI
jgi:hypothetical protein